MQSIKIFNYLKEAETIFNEWTSDEASINGDSRDREPIIAIATMLQAEDHNKTKNNRIFNSLETLDSSFEFEILTCLYNCIV